MFYYISLCQLSRAKIAKVIYSIATHINLEATQELHEV